MAKRPETTNGEGTPPINFADINVPEMMQQRRDQLAAMREDVFNRQAALEQELKAINDELKAIEVFLAVREGRPIPQMDGEKKERKPRQPKDPNAPRVPRQPRGEVRQKVLELIQANPDGLTRSEILEKFGYAQGSKEAQSVSNALTNMQKQSPQPIVRKGDGRWVPA